PYGRKRTFRVASVLLLFALSASSSVGDTCSMWAPPLSSAVEMGQTPSPASPVVSGSVLPLDCRVNSSKSDAQPAPSPEVLKNLLTPSSASRKPSPASRTTRSNSSGSNPKGPLLLIAVPPVSQTPQHCGNHSVPLRRQVVD